MNINWYPGHMAKAKGLIKEKLPLIDVVLEIIDARIPYSSKIRDIDKTLSNKERILIMTKVDLCDLTETNKWLKYYENKGYHVIMVDLLNNKNIPLIILKCRKILNNLNDKLKKKGMIKRSLRVLIIGIPNVGKSTLINRLVGKRVTKVGNKPGLTKGLSWIKIDNSLELLDTPGILWPKFESDTLALNLAATSAIKEEILPLDDVTFYILTMLSKYYPKALVDRYKINDIDLDNIIDVYNVIGQRRGAIIKGGDIDYNKVYRIIINDLNDGLLGRITFDRYNDINNGGDYDEKNFS